MSRSLYHQGTGINSIKSAPEPEVEQGDEHIENAEGDLQYAAAKAGRRHSSRDQKNLQSLHDTAVSLGAECGDKESNAKAAKPAGDADPAQPELEIKPVDLEGLALDIIVSDVRSAFWDLRTADRDSQRPDGVDRYEWFDYDESMCAECVSIYNGYAIAKVGLAYFKVPYSIASHKIALADKASWEQVEKEWVMKSISENAFKAFRMREIGSVKAMPGNRLGNYLVLWGDDKQRDLYGEYFHAEKTAGLADIFNYMGGKVPALYQHGMDGQVKFSPVGVIDTMVADDIGLWTETQLDMANAYAREIQKLARKKALGASSGTLPGARKVAPDGCIIQWPIIEGSFTPTPAEPRLRDLGVAEVKAIYTEMGLEFPESQIKSTDTGDAESRSVAEIEAELEYLRLLEL
jgi:hypothetical protein